MAPTPQKLRLYLIFLAILGSALFVNCNSGINLTIRAQDDQVLNNFNNYYEGLGKKKIEWIELQSMKQTERQRLCKDVHEAISTSEHKYKFKIQAATALNSDEQGTSNNICSKMNKIKNKLLSCVCVLPNHNTKLAQHTYNHFDPKKQKFVFTVEVCPCYAYFIHSKKDPNFGRILDNTVESDEKEKDGELETLAASYFLAKGTGEGCVFVIDIPIFRVGMPQSGIGEPTVKYELCPGSKSSKLKDLFDTSQEE